MSTLIESLAQDRHAQRYESAASNCRGGVAAPTRVAPLEGTRTRAGWLLVGLGLRLAMGRGDTPARGTSLQG
jgi:hypothetical protein